MRVRSTSCIRRKKDRSTKYCSSIAAASSSRSPPNKYAFTASTGICSMSINRYTSFVAPPRQTRKLPSDPMQIDSKVVRVAQIEEDGQACAVTNSRALNKFPIFVGQSRFADPADFVQKYPDLHSRQTP